MQGTWGASAYEKNLRPLITSEPRMQRFATRFGRTFSRLLHIEQRMSPGSAFPQPSQGVLGNFDLVKRVKLDFADVSLSKWRSRATGLNVVHLDYEAPIVKGYFVVPTEIFNDSGCPHTLEHLVFMGSEKYPYKGVLDNLANRAFSNGTNAWTDIDHTCYTIATAGQEGFLRILPVYVDHVLYPTITDHGFVTEVHYIDPEGRDSGVVYSEMQGRENTSGDLMELRMSRLINPPGSAYRSEIGGLMEALRSLTVEQIREYHKTYYAPYNFCLIIAGKVSSTSLLNILQEEVEPSILNHRTSRPPGWKRPFVETTTARRIPVQDIVRETVEFPEKDESCGEVSMMFSGSAPNDYLTAKALEVLSTYLAYSPVAPLNKEFVETSSPFCTDISINENTRVNYCDLELRASSVPTEHLHTLDIKLRDSLRRISDERLDMSRMKMLLKRGEARFRSALESTRGDVFSGVVISDFLYGREDGEDLPLAMSDISLYQTLLSWSEHQWNDLLRKYLVSPPYAVVYGKPSASLADSLETGENERIAEQVARLGEEGLHKLAEKLQEAQAYNDRPIPSEFLTSFPLPDVKGISWISVQTARNSGREPQVSSPAPSGTELDRHLARDTTDLPFFIQYDHVKSDFVTVHAFMSLEELPNHLRPYISLYLGSFFSLPVAQLSTGRRLTHEEVINGLDNETVQYEVHLGLINHFSELIRVSIMVEVAQYERAVAWLSDLITRSVFDKERLEITVAKIRQSLPEMKRDGNTVVESLSGTLLFAESSTAQAGSVLHQTEFVPRLAERLQSAPEEVISDLESFRQNIIQPSGLRFGVTGNVTALQEPKAVWKKAFSSTAQTNLLPVPLSHKTLSTLGLRPCRKAVVMPLPSIESAFAIHSTRAILGFDHPEYPAIRVALEVLNATEGFLWRFIRGAGLAYGAFITLDIESGLLNFITYRSANPFQAFQEAKKIINALADGSVTLDATTLDSSKSSIVYNVTKTVSTPGKAALTSFENQVLREVPQDHTTALLAKYQKVTVQDVINSLRVHILPLFDPSRSVAAVVAGPTKVSDISRGLESIGFEVEERQIPGLLETDGSESIGDESETSDSSQGST